MLDAVPAERSQTLHAAPRLQVRALDASFGSLTVLRGVDLDLRPGEVTALVGENGAGKSTLVRCIAGDHQPDAGTVMLDGTPIVPGSAAQHAVAVVWQDLALCDDLDAVANLFLGRERGRWLLSEQRMLAEARRVFARLGLPIDDLQRPVGSLPGMQRQAVALARAMLAEPRVLVLDEPSAAFEAAQSRVLHGLVRSLAADGVAVLIVSHDPGEIHDVADRIWVLRRGRIIGDLAPAEYHRDDVMALMSGVEVDSTARRQLRRLHSLVDQLSEVAPSASLPLIVSAMADALDQESLCVHLWEDVDGHPRLRRSAAVGLPEPMLARNEVLEIGPSGGSVGQAAATGTVVVVEDVRADPLWAGFREAAAASGIRSAWAAPIAGRDGMLGTVSGYVAVPSGLQADQLDLIEVYVGYAAAAIERDRALADATSRNRVLESMLAMLQVLAGPERVRAGLDGALAALRVGLGADTVGVYTDAPHVAPIAVVDRDDDERRMLVVLDAMEGYADAATSPPVPGTLLRLPMELPSGTATLAALWARPRQPEHDAGDVLQAAARSLRLALEAEALESARQEAVALRRSRDLQREFLQRLSHELRTPLTAIHGFASTLLQSDVEWDAASQHRFLTRIATESQRLGRLVGDLLDAAAIESGLLRLNPDWCELSLILQAARALMPPDARVEIDCPPDVPSLFADHDRLEQVFVNLLANAARYTPAGQPVTAEVTGDEQWVEVAVQDRGAGVDPAVAARIFEPYVHGERGGTGLGLAIAHGIVTAHGGELRLENSPVGARFVVRLPVEPALPRRDGMDTADG